MLSKDGLQMRRIAAKFVLRLWTVDQKQAWQINAARDLLNHLEIDRDFFGKTWDERVVMWIRS